MVTEAKKTVKDPLAAFNWVLEYEVEMQPDVSSSFTTPENLSSVPVQQPLFDPKPARSLGSMSSSSSGE